MIDKELESQLKKSIVYRGCDLCQKTVSHRQQRHRYYKDEERYPFREQLFWVCDECLKRLENK